MMTRRWIAAGTGVALGATLAFSAPATRAAQDAREQHAFATVVDRKGAPIAGLAPTDFAVREDGVKREILRVGPAAAAPQVALLLDTSDAVKAVALQDLRLGAKAFVDGVFTANSGTQMALYTLGDRPTQVVDFASTPIPLLRAVDALFPAKGSGSYFNDAIPEVSRALVKLGAKRPIIVAFIDETGVEFSTTDHTRAALALQTAHAALWAISVPDQNSADRGLPDSAAVQARQEREQIVNDLTAQSGGENVQVFVTSALTTAFTQVSTLLASQYDITYARPADIVPPKHVDVTTSRPNTKLLAPHWGGK
jgi:VWFA-related protein